jgi:nitroreductase
MNIERRDFLEKAFAAGVGLAALAGGLAAYAKELPSDPGASEAPAAGAEEIILPRFEKNSSFALDQAFLKRKTSRNYDDKAAVSREQLSRIMWAAGGINREDGKRTAPSALARYPVDVYAALPEGAYLYSFKEHKLVRVTAEDIRERIPLQPALKKAAMKLLYVVNSNKLLGMEPWMADLEVGCKVQNVYLESASLGLGCCVFALVHYESVTKSLGLKDKQKLRIAQAVGPLMKD